MLALLIIFATTMVGIAIKLGDRILVFLLVGFIMGMFFEREFPPHFTDGRSSGDRPSTE